mgnify:CR=1 FL=1
MGDLFKSFKRVVFRVKYDENVQTHLKLFVAGLAIGRVFRYFILDD